MQPFCQITLTTCYYNVMVVTQQFNYSGDIFLRLFAKH